MLKYYTIQSYINNVYIQCLNMYVCIQYLNVYTWQYAWYYFILFKKSIVYIIYI